ncbi:hypothetical protein ATN81_09290, partial [Agrobacterium pusense]
LVSGTEGVPQNGEQPRFQGCSGGEAVQGTKPPHHGFLNEIVDILVISDETTRKRRQRWREIGNSDTQGLKLRFA